MTVLWLLIAVAIPSVLSAIDDGSGNGLDDGSGRGFNPGKYNIQVSRLHKSF